MCAHHTSMCASKDAPALAVTRFLCVGAEKDVMSSFKAPVCRQAACWSSCAALNSRACAYRRIGRSTSRRTDVRRTATVCINISSARICRPAAGQCTLFPSGSRMQEQAGCLISLLQALLLYFVISSGTQHAWQRHETCRAGDVACVSQLAALIGMQTSSPARTLHKRLGLSAGLSALR